MNVVKTSLSFVVSTCFLGSALSWSKTVETTASTGQGKKLQTKIQPMRPSGGVPEKVNLEGLPNSTVIVTVGGTPITVGNYKRMFNLEQLRLQNAISKDLATRRRFLEEAKRYHIVVSSQEKEKLLNAARGGKARQSEEFKQFLSKRNITEQQFNQEVMDVALAIKTVNYVLEQSVLNELVNRELLCAAGRAAGFSSKAMNNYFQIKHSPNYKVMLEASKLTADQLKEELVKDELNQLMLKRIQENAQASDKEIEAFYNQNHKLFQHKERIKLSQIVIAAPTFDEGPVQSVKTQVLKANPKLSGKELDATVALTLQHQRQKAQEILGRAKAGEDFASLANLYTEDIPAKVAKSGGDLGFQEREHLVPKLGEALWPLKAGSVYPDLIQSSLGFHIVKVTQHEPPGTVPLSEVKGLLRTAVKQKKNSNALNQWLAKKRSTTKIVLSPRFAQLVGDSKAASTALAAP